MRRSTLVAPTNLAAGSVVHAAWALDASWPAADRRSLAASVAGSADMPGALTGLPKIMSARGAESAL